MKIRGVNFSISRIFILSIYYGIVTYIPWSLGNKIRALFCCLFLEKVGKHVTIKARVYFGSGIGTMIGNNSEIGKGSIIPAGTIIGNDVMIAPNCCIVAQNHNFEKLDVPIRLQGFSPKKRIVIEDDVWIGRNVMIMPGCIVRKGSVIAGGCVLCKKFPRYSIVGGNPSRLIRSRI